MQRVGREPGSDQAWAGLLRGLVFLCAVALTLGAASLRGSAPAPDRPATVRATS